MSLTYLRVPGESALLLDCDGGRLPRVLHWGADLGDLPASDRTGSVVLVWITDLGDAVEGGRHRVEIAEVTVSGSATGG